jgi:ribosomal subunit interface protein
MLNYNIKGTGLELSDEVRGYAEKKLQHAAKFLHHDTTAHADIELEYRATRSGEQYRAEFTVTSGSKLYRAEEWGETMHSAIDLAIGELSSEISRNKQKRLHVLRRGAQRVKDYVRGWSNKV